MAEVTLRNNFKVSSVRKVMGQVRAMAGSQYNSTLVLLSENTVSWYRLQNSKSSILKNTNENPLTN